MNEQSNPYEVLGIERKATLKEIKSAYRRLAFEVHPDYNSEPDAGERFKRLQWAYEQLMDSRTRAKVDQGLDDGERIEYWPSTFTISVTRDGGVPGSPGDAEPEETWREHWHVWRAEKDDVGEKVTLFKIKMPFFKRHPAQVHGHRIQTFEWGFSVLQCRPDLDGCSWRGRGDPQRRNSVSMRRRTSI